ncbi:MAG: hypothetical protein PHY92_09705 [Alphaproteobacteria bacterium]|nr:hypothetical protein [Alphaproteobacteria bacterium]
MEETQKGSPVQQFVRTRMKPAEDGSLIVWANMENGRYALIRTTPESEYTGEDFGLKAKYPGKQPGDRSFDVLVYQIDARGQLGGQESNFPMDFESMKNILASIAIEPAVNADIRLREKLSPEPVSYKTLFDLTGQMPCSPGPMKAGRSAPRLLPVNQRN